jgi:DNA-binding IclR family transcriptional regulator
MPAPLRRDETLSRGIRDLLDAAGPLTVAHIAGGLNLTLREASQAVHSMVKEGCLGRDEWRRYRLTDVCA